MTVFEGLRALPWIPAFAGMTFGFEFGFTLCDPVALWLSVKVLIFIIVEIARSSRAMTIVWLRLLKK
jgi:hypothetical protein